jgi:hypothetical protein
MKSFIVFFLVTILMSSNAFAKNISRRISQELSSCPQDLTGKLNQLNTIHKCSEAISFIKQCSPNDSNEDLSYTANKICNIALRPIAKVDQDLKKRMMNRCRAVYCSKKVASTICQSSMTFCEFDSNNFIMQFYYDNDY